MAVKNPPKPEKELSRALNREQVATRKLDRLKDRYDRLKTITDTQFDKQSEQCRRLEAELRESQAYAQELAARCLSLQDEAGMWKSQLFEQLDRLDANKREFHALQTELAEAQWQLVELVDLERTRCETALARSQAELHQMSKELVASQSRVDGLKNLGTCLVAKLERATTESQRWQREHARLAEVAEMRANLLEVREAEIAALRDELFEVRGQLVSHRLESQTWNSLRRGLEQAPQETHPESEESAAPTEPTVDCVMPRVPSGRRRLKLAPPPCPESRLDPLPKRLLKSAGKTVGGWLRLNKPE